ncbi:DUF5686 and carboxypeptidase regulatory-like domain-containing protein [Lacibacter sp. MH-610]|uniref:DUF5686 and carboxypeptidase regulatory-like domain-containing protein n=1 Tax=Lacibacter sp. MH-610 TaxID=3020883 RepID=UPI003891552C
MPLLSWAMKPLLFLCFSICMLVQVNAGTVSGTVTAASGELLPFSSVTIKGKNIQTNANSQAYYFLELPAGTYTIICRHVGYERVEQTITVTGAAQTLHFVLPLQKVNLKEVVVNSGAEDPAYAIIRNAIAKRKEHLQENDVFQCEVYSKGTMSLRNYPKRFMGETVDFEDGDTSKKKMIYLSETVSKLSIDKPNKVKIDVLSTRVSGKSDGYGFAGARFFSFYENNVQISSSLNPRGFVSPIADNALSMYRYKYEGAFSEEGKLINKIKVIPRRKLEPCFSGYINIVEDEWRIHSLELQLTKQSQMDFADTLRIEQLYQMLGVNEWVVQSQVLYPSVKIFGFDAYGTFANVYRNFNTQPGFDKKYFNNTVLKYEKGSNKKPVSYWDSIRPLKLSDAEMKDYVKKDSLEQLRKNPAYLDSLDRINNKLKPMNLLVTGKTFNRQKHKTSFSIPSVLNSIQFNSVEGWVGDLAFTFNKQYTDRKNLSFTPHVRYGFSSEQFYGWGTLRYNFGEKYFSNITVSGGKRIFQLNNDNPIEPFQNTVSSLFYRNNFMKLYAADYFRISFTKGVGKGLTVYGGFQFQDRKPLENTTDYAFISKNKASYKPNYPVELLNGNFTAHQAAVVNIGIQLQPGARYVEFPDRTINIGSKWPVFNLQYVKGVNGLLGSDIDFDRWQFSVRDNLNLKLLGRFNYRVQLGGFTNTNRVEVQDLKHFPGNRLFRAEDYLTAFQLPQYYQFSNSAHFYTAAFAEHHFNGLLTNKIPVIKKLNWHLVGGVGYLRLPQTNYFEWHVGLENIFRILRFDVVNAYQTGAPARIDFRIGSSISIGGSND